MSNNSPDIGNNSEYLEDRYVEDEWTDGCSRLFSSVFTIYEPWHKQLFECSHDQKLWLIQVKRRENPKRAEPVETIRNLLGTMLLEGSCNGIVVSTVDHFSYLAHQAANRAAEVGMTVKLIDKGILNRMLEVALPNVLPWLLSLMNSYIEFPSESLRKIPDPNYRQLTM